MIEGKNKEAIDETSSLYPAYVAKLGADHELTMQLLTTRAQCEGAIGLWDAAIRDDLAIYNLALHKQGPLSFFAVATLSDAALAECRAGRFSEGEPNARKAFESSAKAFGPRAGLTGGTAYALATCRIGLGKVGEASTSFCGLRRDLQQTEGPGDSNQLGTNEITLRIRGISTGETTSHYEIPSI